MATDVTLPSALEVQNFHTNADTDGKPMAIHHTLGPSPNAASPGNHTHDGGASALLLDGITISGAKGGNAALVTVIAALVKLGATDTSTA
jgi:hypothetical protein